MMPVAYDVVWTVVALAAVVLMLVALRAWFHDRRPAIVTIVGALVIVLVPVIGPAAYLLSRRGGAVERTD